MSATIIGFNYRVGRMITWLGVAMKGMIVEISAHYGSTVGRGEDFLLYCIGLR